MKSIINKIGMLLLAVTLVFTSCETEETLKITAPEAEFVLNAPGVSTIFLNFGLPDNPAFTVSWNDMVTGSNFYNVEMATDSDFTSPIALGTTESSNFSMTVAEFNTVLNSLNTDQFKDIPVYLRVTAGGAISNTILLLATKYPVNAPQFSSPSNNDTFELSLTSSEETAITVSWEDAILSSSLGIEVIYTVEAALGETNFDSPVIFGTLTNGNSISATHSDLNAVALGLGLIPNTAGDVDMRIISRNTNATGDTLERISETITVSITPYTVSFPNLYFVGDATAPGWNNDNNNTPVFRDQNLPNGYLYTGYFNAGAFKLLENLGEWQPQWGTNDGSTLAVNLGGGSDPGTFNVSNAGYYTYTFTTVGEGGSFTVTSYDASSAATYPTIGIIGDATPAGWSDDTDFTQDSLNPHLWHLDNVTLTNGGQMLIRANNVWPPDSNAAIWRYTGSQELYGTARLDNGGGDNIPFNEPTGSYDIWFNDLDGSYIIIPN